MKTTNHFQKSSVKLPKLVNNPLDAFPTKGDVIKRNFLFAPPAAPPTEESSWLVPNRIPDASFGVADGDPHSQGTRAYRRVASSSLFSATHPNDTPLNDLHPATKLSHKNYVLVEESRLSELIKLDEALQRERRRLGDRCLALGLATGDIQTPARIPLPATRLAIHRLCESQLTRVRGEIVQLQRQWTQFQRANHYHKPHLYLQDSYLNIAPPSQRAMKLRLVKEAVSTWNKRRERDSMLYEDDLSLLTGLYYDALARQRDYERYYILASRYGAMDEKEFLKDDRPGRRYFQRTSKAALIIQRLWDRYWAVAKLRRFRLIRLIQKHWRRYIIYKKLHPVIRLRMKIGKKTYYRFALGRWREYNAMCKWIRESIAFFLESKAQQCFKAWKGWAKSNREERIRRMGKVLLRAKQPAAYNKLRQWKLFVRHVKQLKRRLKLLFQVPHFYRWIDFVKWRKHMRKLHKAATLMQALGRRLLGRNKLRKRQYAHRKVLSFVAMAIAKMGVNALRTAHLRLLYVAWKPGELNRRMHRRNEQERQRLQRRQLFLADRERQAINELKQYLSSVAGIKQLEELTQAKIAEKQQKSFFRWGLNTIDKHRLLNEFARELKDQCVTVTRAVEAQAFEVKYPAFIRCPHPLCGACFAAEEQYHSHLALSAAHQPPKQTDNNTVEALLTVKRVTAIISDDGQSKRYKDHTRARYDSSSSDTSSDWDAEDEAKSNLHSEVSKKSSYEKKKLPQFLPLSSTQFHLLLRHGKGFEQLRHRWLSLLGLSGPVNLIDASAALQELHRTPANGPQFVNKVLTFYDLYLRPDAPRRCLVGLNLSVEYERELFAMIDIQRLRLEGSLNTSGTNQNKMTVAAGYPGLYRRHQYPPTSTMECLGIDGPFLKRCDPEQVFLPPILEQLEYAIFHQLFVAYQADEFAFLSSDEGKVYLEEIALEQRLQEEELYHDFLKQRNGSILDWARAYKAHEDDMRDMAGLVVKNLLELEIDRLFSLAAKQEVKRRATEYRHIEQAKHEEMALLLDEALTHAEEDTVELLFSFYVKSLLVAMWEVPDNRRGMMQFAGFLKVNLRGAKNAANRAAAIAQSSKSSGRSTNATNAAQESRAWFDNFFKETSAIEKKQVPLNKDMAAIRIQRQWRAGRGRGITRRIFARTFKKYYDEAEGAYYYFNVATGEATWEPPKIFGRLYPKAKSAW